MRGNSNSFIASCLLLLLLVADGVTAQTTGNVVVTVGVTGDAATLSPSTLPSSVLDSEVIPLAESDILVSAVGLPGTSKNTTAGDDTSSASGVSVWIIVMSVLGGLTLAIVTGLAVYHIIRSRNAAPAAPSVPSHQPHGGGGRNFILPGPMAPRGLLSICLHPNDVQGGFYNQIIQMDLNQPPGHGLK